MKQRLHYSTMANQLGKGGAVSCHAAAPSNPGQGSSAPPGAQDTSTPDPNPGGIIHMTPEAYFTRYGPPAAPSPAPSVQLLPSQHKCTPSPEHPSPAKFFLNTALLSAAGPPLLPPSHRLGISPWGHRLGMHQPMLCRPVQTLHPHPVSIRC